MENCCDSMLKYIVFICNFAFFFSGVVLMAMGIYIHVGVGDYLNFVDDGMLSTGTVLIVLGVIILVMGFFGCCGAVTENACMMFFFATMLAIIIIAEITIGVMVYIYKDDAQATIENKMVAALQNYNGTEFEGVTQTWGAIQTDFKCCGVNNYTDWAGTPFGNGVNVPNSCCIANTPDCGMKIIGKPDVSSSINVNGCVSNLYNLIVDNAQTIMIVGVIIILVEFVGVLVTCMLANNMRRRSNYV